MYIDEVFKKKQDKKSKWSPYDCGIIGFFGLQAYSANRDSTLVSVA